jgi:hypothetical protein
MLELMMIRRVAIVGNGSISRADAVLIDGFELVIRFNEARDLGRRGRRADVLAIRHLDTAARIGAENAAVQTCGEIWIVNDRAQGVPPFLFGKPCRALKMPTLRGIERPSSGCAVVATILGTAEIHIFGFTHKGWTGHDWDAERRWFDELVRTGRITHHRSPERWCWAALDKIASRIARLSRSVKRRVYPSPS